MALSTLLVAGTHSGVGKTTVTMGLALLLRQSGARVQPFKSGPDYIDPGYLSKAAGRTCRNLDRWLIPEQQLANCFAAGCRQADWALIEGVMGLHDGIGATSEVGSTAQLAKQLDCPVLLVLDASALSRSAAAMALGFASLDPKVKVAGCFLNRVAGESHYQLVKEGIERLTGLPVIGWLPRSERLRLPERHLGLVPTLEQKNLKKIFGPLLNMMQRNVDRKRLRRLTGKSRLPRAKTHLSRNSQSNKPLVRIGVAMDEAFHFYYPENLELIEQNGAKLVPWSPLQHKRLPQGIHALYLGGGFPEVFAQKLSRNRKLKESVRQAISEGMPTYAECGGLMYLSSEIQDSRGKRHPMVGVLPRKIQMTCSLQHFGYQEVQACKSSLLGRVGERARGHEFHHSRLSRPLTQTHAAYTASSPTRGIRRWEGYATDTLVASYIHLHFWSQPTWAKRFVQAARRHLREKP